MNKWTKFVIGFALAFLAVIIGIGIGNRSTDKIDNSIKPSKHPKNITASKQEPGQLNIEKGHGLEKTKKWQRTEIYKEDDGDVIFIPPEERVSPPAELRPNQTKSLFP